MRRTVWSFFTETPYNTANWFTSYCIVYVWSLNKFCTTKWHFKFTWISKDYFLSRLISGELVTRVSCFSVGVVCQRYNLDSDTMSDSLSYRTALEAYTSFFQICLFLAKLKFHSVSPRVMLSYHHKIRNSWFLLQALWNICDPDDGGSHAHSACFPGLRLCLRPSLSPSPCLQTSFKFSGFFLCSIFQGMGWK